MAIIIYADFGCPYCYLASLRADQLLWSGIAEIDWRAVTDRRDPPDDSRGRKDGRDDRDRSREAAPLMPAPDAMLLDTSELDIDATFAAALALVQPRIEEALKTRRRG